jgi:hypothetical protein
MPFLEFKEEYSALGRTDKNAGAATEERTVFWA